MLIFCFSLGFLSSIHPVSWINLLCRVYSTNWIYRTEVEGSTPTGGTCPNDFSDPIDQDIRTQWALSWQIVVSEWRSVIAVSLNVGGGVRLIKPAKLYMCMQNTTNTTRTDARRRVCAAMVPYRWATRGTSLRELEYTHNLLCRYDLIWWDRTLQHNKCTVKYVTRSANSSEYGIWIVSWHHIPCVHILPVD